MMTEVPRIDKDDPTEIPDGHWIDTDGDEIWIKDHRYHRTDGPALQNADGTKKWLLNGLFHRTDGPAIEWTDGTKMWYLNGLFHRTDGPAVIKPNGQNVWWLNDQKYTFAEWLEANTALTEEQKVMMKLEYR